ncbi:MAG: hypothetical protein COT73_00970 [Bdellovibrio sp. CG10_big_fil_rev_8_21_14_0_10_47_8]|nr:MAG: hypothetical protein COT73_00970 [Bdellovibrio sp. CG10_big_fil_rev_8_21_14_0_10_47_8]
MRIISLLVTGVALTYLFHFPLAQAQYVPKTLAFQGYLATASGAAVTSTTSLRFGIYIDSTRVWYAEYSTVAFSNGRCSVQLGGTAQGGQALDATTGATIANSNLPIPGFFQV